MIAKVASRHAVGVTIAWLLGTGVILLATSSHGPGVSPDSANYLAAARSLLAQGELLEFTGDAFATWPPGFPILLALGSLVTGLDALPLARVLNALAHGAIAALSLWYLQQKVGREWIAWAATATVMLGYPLVYTASWVLSEPLFNFFLLSALLLMTSRAAGRSSRRDMALLSVLVAAVVLTRYAGVVIGVPVLIWSLLDRERHLARRLLRGALVLLPAVAGLAAWSLRNLTVGAGALGGRPAARYTLVENVAWAARSISSWFVSRADILPGISVSGWTAVAMAALAGSLAAAGVAGVAGVALLLWRRSGWIALAITECWPLGLWAVAYLAFLLFTFTFVTSGTYAAIDLRLTAPLFAPAVILGTLVLTNWLLHVRRAAPALALNLVAGLLVALILIRGVSAVGAYASEGVGGYASARWADTGLSELVRRLGEDSAIYSDRPDAVYLFTGREARWAPVKYEFPDSKVHADDLATWVSEVVDRSGGYLIWFGDGARPHFYSPGELRHRVALVLLDQRGPAALYAIDRYKKAEMSGSLRGASPRPP